MYKAILFNCEENEIIAIKDYIYNFNLQTGLFIFENEHTDFGILNAENIKKMVVLETDEGYTLQSTFMEEVFDEGLYQEFE